MIARAPVVRDHARFYYGPPDLNEAVVAGGCWVKLAIRVSMMNSSQYDFLRKRGQARGNYLFPYVPPFVILLAPE